MIKSSKILRFAIIGIACGMLSACVNEIVEDFQASPLAGLFPGDEINVTEQNYAAADYLVGQVQTFIQKRNDFIQVKELVDIDEPELHSPIGKAVPLEIGSRFSQLGYQVDLTEVATGAEADFLENAPAYKNVNPDFLIAGNIKRNTRDVDIRLRVVEAKTGRVISSYDYTLPFNYKIRKEALPETRILRMENGVAN